MIIYLKIISEDGENKKPIVASLMFFAKVVAAESGRPNARISLSSEAMPTTFT